MSFFSDHRGRGALVLSGAVVAAVLLVAVVVAVGVEQIAVSASSAARHADGKRGERPRPRLHLALGTCRPILAGGRDDERAPPTGGTNT